MARITEAELERLKSEVSLERLVEARGVKLKRHGADLMGLCPFHEDREPSLVVSPKKNLWHCLGACQTGGSVIDWVMRAEGVSFRHAVEVLRADFPSLAAASALEASASAAKPSAVHKLENIAQPDEPDSAVLGRVVDYYHATLKQNASALGYLRERGLVHAELVEHFRLGFSNRTLSYRLPDKGRQSGAALRGQLQRLGVLRESGHEHMAGSLVIPILGGAGEVLGMYGRKISGDGRLRAGTPLHLYLPGPHRGVFNEPELSVSTEVILCEALIDALTFWCAGFRNVTSAYGVEGFTQDHLDAFKRHGVQRVLIAYDRDEAGERAAEKLAPQLAAAGLEAMRVVFPRGMDANEYARKVTPADKALSTVVGAAKWLAGSRPVQVPRQSSVDVPRQDPPAVQDADAPASGISSLVAAAAAPESVAMAASDPAAHSGSHADNADVATSTEVQADEVTLQLGARSWRVRGLSKNTSLASIKVSIRVLVGTVFFQDTLEVLSARSRAVFLKQASEELGQEERVLKADLGKVILRLEELLEAQLKDKLTPKKAGYQMSEAEEQTALELLRDPKLCERIVGDFERCGVVGEETNKLVGYLAAVSRKLEAPLGVVLQSSSAAGKSSLMDAVLRFVPEEEQVSYSAMTGQSLFYMGGADLRHKVLAIAEEEGAHNAAYALKVLQSSGELTIASTGKDPVTGRLVTHEYRVQGPVMVMLTTTSIEIDEELLNRCVVLTVDEGREQTRAIQRLQRESRTLDGLMRKQERGQLLLLHQNAQRLLLPVHVVNPFARELHFADHATRTRRDHAKYLTLIDTITLLHQYQRPVKTAQVNGAELRYIEVTRADIELANKLAAQVLARSLDELAPQTRRLLGLVGELVSQRATSEGVDRGDVRFTQREVRVFTGWGPTQLKVHLRTLQELEYVAVHYQGHRQRHLYELLVGTETVEPSPLVSRAHGYDANRSGEYTNRSASGRVHGRPVLANDSGVVVQPVGVFSGASQDERDVDASYTSSIAPLAAAH